MKNLTIYNIDATDHLVKPNEFDDISLSSSALTILTDFREHHPHTVESHIPAAEAAKLMHQGNVRYKLVVDKNKEFIGLVSAADLSEQRILLTQVSNRIAREDVLVADLMHHRESVNAINYEDFKKSTVADIVHTMQRHGQEYYLVVDREQHHIRGVVFSEEISRRLHVPVNVERHPSVAEMLSVVKSY